MTTLNSTELSRYSRHLIIPEFGIEGQKKLKKSRVLVVGTGGLGAPLLQYLTAAGIGTIGVLDFDVVEDSNLQRQVLFSTSDIGRPKVEAAAERLQSQNPHVKFILHNTRLTSENALDIFKDYDIIADGTDNFPTRYLVNDAAVKLGKVNVYASIFRFDGQVSVFNYRDANGEYGPNFRDLFPSPPPPGLVPSCAEGGVIGVLPGIIGSLQANEVIKVASGVGEPLSGRLFTLDASAFETRIFNLTKSELNTHRSEDAESIELIDYQQFCGIEETKEETEIKSITPIELQAKIDQKEEIQIIDVREPFEYEISNINGLLIPKGDVLDHVAKIDSDRPVIVHCKAGTRSASVIRLLEAKYGFKNLYNLEGGILAYADQVNTALIKY